MCLVGMGEEEGGYWGEDGAFWEEEEDGMEVRQDMADAHLNYQGEAQVC